METRILDTTMVRIYPRDHLQIWDITSPGTVTAIQEAFRFEGADLDGGSEEEGAGTGRIFFTRGYPDANASESRTIRSVEIRDQRIEVIGADPDGHEALDRFFLHLGAVLGGIVGRENGGEWLAKTITTTNTTLWIGRLDINPDDLLAPPFRVLANAVKDGCATPQVKPLVSIKTICFSLAFHIQDTELLESGVNFKDKELRLEPRAGVPLHERVWFSTSPLRSNRHIELLANLEKDMGATK